MKGLITVLNDFVQSQEQKNTAFNKLMAEMKFRSSVAELSEEKTSNSFIDSGATHNNFDLHSLPCNESLKKQ